MSIINIVSPYYNQAAAFASPYFGAAKATAMPYINSAIATVAPYFNGAVKFATPYASAAYNTAAPYVASAYNAAAPYVNAAVEAATPYAKASFTFVMTPAGAATATVAIVTAVGLVVLAKRLRANKQPQKQATPYQRAQELGLKQARKVGGMRVKKQRKQQKSATRFNGLGNQPNRTKTSKTYKN